MHRDLIAFATASLTQMVTVRIFFRGMQEYAAEDAGDRSVHTIAKNGFTLLTARYAAPERSPKQTTQRLRHSRRLHMRQKSRRTRNETDNFEQAGWVCAGLREHLKRFKDKEDIDGKTDV